MGDTPADEMERFMDHVGMKRATEEDIMLLGGGQYPEPRGNLTTFEQRVLADQFRAELKKQGRITDEAIEDMLLNMMDLPDKVPQRDPTYLISRMFPAFPSADQIMTQLAADDIVIEKALDEKDENHSDPEAT